MRISSAEINAIVQAITPFISPNSAELRLYGSRVHAHLKGGDLDLLLLVEEPEIADALKLQKHHLLAEIKKQLGDRKIDVLFASREEILTQAFIDLIFQESVLLYVWQ